MKNYLLLIILCSFICCKNQPKAAEENKPEKQEEKERPEKQEKPGNAAAELFAVGKPDASWAMPPELLEISGISWIDATHLMAIEDLHASLYVLSLGKDVSVEKVIPFKKDKDKKFDVEDVAMAGNSAFTIWSHGAIFEIGNWKSEPQVTEYTTGLTKEDNTEGICFDPVTGNLLIACKGRGENTGEKKSTRAVYQFNMKDKTLVAEPLFLIKKKEFAEKSQEEVDFNPSAISIDPISNNIYILSTKGSKCLASFDRKGNLLTFQNLDAAIFPQPEGLCFSPEGTLYISSEGKKTAGMIYKFNRAK